ncbi:MAG: laccase domain-containing protein [Moraxellaceae bacterium]|nr:laccase domain-containing protein [Moraxellaceae bacterium]
MLNIIHQNNHILVVQTLTDNLENPYGTFNLGLHVGDNPTQVLANRAKLLAELNQLTNHSIKNIHWLNQVHGDKLLNIDNLADNQQYKLQNADALTTKQQGQALAIMTADCVPIMLHCQQTGRIIAIHAGWQGLANGIISKSVKQCQNKVEKIQQCDKASERRCISNTSSELNTVAQMNFFDEKWQAWIGACISVDNYEVSQEVLNKIIDGTLKHFAFKKDTLIKQISKPHQDNKKAWINLPMLAQLQLKKLGVQLMTDDIACSYANNNYYSHRQATHKQQKNTGRMAMLIVKINSSI